ncbi:MAG: BTAD domain-containing putative transcriptional regulator, partial [Pygmaiobacter sp.]
MKEMLVDTKDVVTVKMLGGFSVYVGEKLIVANDAGGQIWNLLEYLLVNRHKPVTQEQMMEVLWDDEVEDPAAALKNLVYRLRKEFTVAGVPIAKQMVLSSGGVYRWNNSVPTEIDVEKYETLCQQASEEQDPAAHMALARAALDLYSGDFLPGAYHRAWITPLNRYYHALYFKQAYALLAEYEESENWVEMLNVASKAVEIDCFEEDGHRYVLQALSKLGRQTQAISYYNYVSDLFYREMGVDLSAKLRQMFSEIAKTVKINSLDLAGLKQDLRENDQVSGAYY